MPLSKEFYLDEIRSKHPNSYNESLKDLPVKDLADMLDFLDEALGKADGGAIGIEVLFTDKKPRKNFFMGGPALEGQALDIYTSMNKYGFSDQEIADALSARGLYTPSGATPGDPITGIINQQINQGRDTGPTRPTSEIVTDFQETITNRQNKLNNPGKIASFVGDFIPQQRSVADMLASGQVDTRLTSGIPFGVSGLIAKALPDKYYDMSLADQITTQAYMGFTDPNTNMANKDPFGLNVRSAFGNYAEKAAEIVGTLEDKLARRGELSKYDQARLDHYRNVTKTKQDAVADIGLINLAKQQAEEKRQRDIQEAATRRTYSLSDLQDSSDRGTGQSYAAARERTASRVGPGGNVKAYGLADGGRVGLFMGGDPLTGQALQIYNSMNAYGFSDEEIADALRARGLYDVAPTTTTPVTNTTPNIINQGGGEGSTPPGPKTFDKGFSSANFGLGRDVVNKDAVVDYEAEAYNVGPTLTGTFARALSSLKSIPTPFNIARIGIQKAIDFAKQKELEKKAREEAIARDLARSIQEQNKANRTGGYQSDFSQDSDFMGGGGTAAEMGSFKRGGLATMFTRRR
jgi:hypothetical protein